MVMFVGSRDMAAFTSEVGPERFIHELALTIEGDFARWQSFDLTPRIASHTPIGVIELMPTSDGRYYSFKYVNGHPSNPARGYQTVAAFGALADVYTGYPVLLAEMTLLTALRTAAVSAVASGLLARQDSQRMAMIGAGSQAEFQALGHRAAVGVNELTIWDVDHDAMTKAAGNLEGLGFEVRIANGAEDAVAGADIITTCTADKALATVLFDEWVKPGVHINAIGGDCPGKTELEPAILHRGPVFVEHPPQTRIEGEIQHQPDDFPVTELWRVITRQEPGRETDEQVTIFDSVGFAIADFSALSYVHGRAPGTGHFIDIDLIAEPDDPKDLFGMIGAPVPA